MSHVFYYKFFVFRYAPADLPVLPKCKHNTKSLKCGSLTMSDLMNIHKHFYAKSDKIYQDNFLLKYCVTKNIQRRRPSTMGVEVPEI